MKFIDQNVPSYPSSLMPSLKHTPHKFSMEMNTTLASFEQERSKQLKEIEDIKREFKDMKERSKGRLSNSKECTYTPNVYIDSLKKNKRRIDFTEGSNFEQLKKENETLREELEAEKINNLKMRKNFDLEIDAYKKEIREVKLNQIEIENEACKSMRLEIMRLNELLFTCEKERDEAKSKARNLLDELASKEEFYKGKLQVIEDEVRANKKHGLKQDNENDYGVLDEILSLTNFNERDNNQTFNTKKKLLYLRSAIERLIKEKEELNKKYNRLIDWHNDLTMQVKKSKNDSKSKKSLADVE